MKVIEDVTSEPLTLAECRLHLRVDASEDSDGGTHPDDSLITALLTASREVCEAFTGLSFARKTLEIAIDVFPLSTDPGGLPIELPFGPVLDVQSISWGDASDDEMAAVDYTLDDYRLPNRVYPVATEWPTVTAATNLIKIRYLAGYGVDSDGGTALPYAARAAMLLVLGHLYENREDTVDKQMFELPYGAQALLRPLRVRLGMA